MEYAIQVLQEGVLLSRRSSLSDSSDEKVDAADSPPQSSSEVAAIQVATIASEEKADAADATLQSSSDVPPIAKAKAKGRPKKFPGLCVACCMRSLKKAGGPPHEKDLCEKTKEQIKNKGLPCGA